MIELEGARLPNWHRHVVVGGVEAAGRGCVSIGRLSLRVHAYPAGTVTLLWVALKPLVEDGLVWDD